MSSGIGAYAPRYMQVGGGVVGEVYDEVKSRTGALDDVQSGNTAGQTPLTFEQFIANATTGPGGLINGQTKQQAYDAYLAAFSGGFRGQAQGSAGVNTTTLPSYLTVEGGLVRIDPSATNLQFVNLLNDLGFFSGEEYDGLTDYEWFVKATQDNPDATWISQLFNDPNKDFVVDGDFSTRSGYSETNLERFRRLANLINPASQSGGAFQATAQFLADKGQSLTGGVSGSGTVGRQVFIGQRPTGLGLDPNTGQPSAQQPFYTQSDVLVDSTEQPNLYTYNVDPSTGVGQFDPMITTTTANPFDTPATPLSTSYTAPTTTTSFDSNVDFSQIFGNVVTPDQVRAFYRMYLGRDPGVNQYVMQFVNSGKTIDQIETEIMNSPEAQNFSITGTPVSSAEELAQITAERNAVTPEKVRGFYQQYLGRDPGNNEFVMGWVNSGMSLADVEAQISASAEAQNFATTGVAAVTPTAPAVTLQSVQDLYQKNLGRQGAEEYVMNWVNSGMSLADIDQAIQNSPEGISYSSNVASTAAATGPDVTSQDRVQTDVVSGGGEGTLDNVTTLSTGAQDTTTVSPAPPPTTNEQGIPIGATGLTSTQAAIQALEERRKREAAAANTGAGGFATGGIVGLTDGMSLEANSGQGLESFYEVVLKRRFVVILRKLHHGPRCKPALCPWPDNG
jgi:hypothetical protein